MRINKFLALHTDLSRRSADEAVAAGRVTINGNTAEQGTSVAETDSVTLDGHAVDTVVKTTTILLNKPAGYVVSRNGQGSPTVYELLPLQYQQLNPVGRLDKDSSGLLLLTNDGQLAQQLTHPSHQKAKVYEVALNKPLQPLHRQMISDHGIMLEDGLSRLQLERLKEGNDTAWQVTMTEGRNRQIRRTFESLGYTVRALHRTHFGPYVIDNLAPGKHKLVQA